MKSRLDNFNQQKKLINLNINFNIFYEKINKSVIFQEMCKYFIRRMILKNLHKQINGRTNLEDLLRCFKFENGKKVIPHRKKRDKGGEDCNYIIDRLLVVADGVGGWKNHQVDPAEFSKELCQNISDNFHQYELYLKIKDKNYKKNISLSLSDVNYENEYKEGMYSESVVKKLLIKSNNTAKNLGTSTCTILLLEKNTGKLFTSYVGDSLYMILRYDILNKKYYLEYKADEQMHSETFNTPFQIGKDGDDPEVAITNTHLLKNDDLIITASDGLWDNLEIERIIEIINENTKIFPSLNPQELANIIAEEADRKSNDKNYFSPFARKVKKNNLYYLGGKPDDITVIVSHLTNKDSQTYDSSANTSTTDNNEKNDEFLN